MYRCADGGLVTFGDDNSAWIHDVARRRTIRFWHEPNHPDAPFPAGTVGRPVISGNGRFVSFQTFGKFAAKDRDTKEDVYVRDVLERASARETTMRVACGAVCRRLLAEFGRMATLEGAQVVRVGCQARDTERPLSIFVDAVPLLLAVPGALGCAPESMAYLRRLTAHDPAVPVLRHEQREQVAGEVRERHPGAQHEVHRVERGAGGCPAVVGDALVDGLAVEFAQAVEELVGPCVGLAGHVGHGEFFQGGQFLAAGEVFEQGADGDAGTLARQRDLAFRYGV